jgi:hypothetical protein
VVLDLYDRKVIGQTLGADRETDHTTIPALEMAFASRRHREGLLFHSDRGVQYCARLLCAANSLPLSSVRVFRIGAGMDLKARSAALFKAAALLSGMIFARSGFVFRSTNAAM